MGQITITPEQAVRRERLPLRTKLLYGSGDWSMASYNTLRQIFYAIFLTDVVGLDPRLASVAAFVGILWDAINDPVVGTLSDRVRTRWGRRRPFFLFSIPFGLGFLFLWWAPPWQSQVGLMLTVMAAYMLADTLQTLVIVPYLAMTPELTPDYDERTSITSFRMFWNLIASLLAAAAAPAILDAVVGGGGSQQQGYLIVAAVFGGLAIVPFLLMFAFLREPAAPPLQEGERREPVRHVFRTLWRNVPFRYATALNMLTWVSLDLVGLILPFFLTYWIAQGDLLAQANLFGMSLGLETAVLGVLFIVAIVFLPFWAWLAGRMGKQQAFIIGAAFWAAVQISMVLLQPGEIEWVLRLAALAGIGLSMAQVLPDAIFPDVVEWDELLTRRRREGAYYGAKNFVRKLNGRPGHLHRTAGPRLVRLPGAPGWHACSSNSLLPRLLRFACSPGRWVRLLLVAAIIVAWFYPITRARHARIRRLFAQRQRLTGPIVVAGST